MLAENYRHQMLPRLALSIILVAAILIVFSHHEHPYFEDNHCAICKFATDVNVPTVEFVSIGHIAVKEWNIIPSNTNPAGVHIVRGSEQRAPPQVS